MDLVLIGKLVNTHGIKGEVRIISDFEFKEDVFKPNNSIYINNTKYTIKTYRHHKNFEMVTLSNIENIDSANKLKGQLVFIDRTDYKFDRYLNQDLIGLDVYDKDEFKGKIVDVLKSDLYFLLVVEGKKRHMIPNIPKFIESVNLKEKRINVKYIRGLDLEN